MFIILRTDINKLYVARNNRKQYSMCIALSNDDDDDDDDDEYEYIIS